MSLVAGFEPGYLDAPPPVALKYALGKGKQFIAEMRGGEKIGHYVVVEGEVEGGGVLIRDPEFGARYEVTKSDFLKYWSGYGVFAK
jgi:Peptidase C39 family